MVQIGGFAEEISIAPQISRSNQNSVAASAAAVPHLLLMATRARKGHVPAKALASAPNAGFCQELGVPACS